MSGDVKPCSFERPLRLTPYFGILLRRHHLCHPPPIVVRPMDDGLSVTTMECVVVPIDLKFRLSTTLHQITCRLRNYISTIVQPHHGFFHDF